MIAEVLDLFSAAAGGWSLGMHRAGYKTIAACENVEWRRALYAQNNPDVLIYDDVRTLTAERLRRDLGCLPGVIVGSPPCQDISSANTKGLGVDGEQSGLFFEAVRIIGECQPRWFALENSANLRTRGADRVLAALEAVGYAPQAFVVGAGDVGANHERKRAWIIGFNIAQLAVARLPISTGRHPARGGFKRPESNEGIRPLRFLPQQNNADADGFRSIGFERRRLGSDLSVPLDAGDASDDRRSEGWPWGRSVTTEGLSVETCGHADSACLGHDGRRPRRHGPDGNGSSSIASGVRNAAHADQAGQADGCMVAGIRQEEISDNGCGAERRADVAHAYGQGQSDGAEHAEMGRSASAGGIAGEPWAGWNGGLAASLRLDDGLSAWLAQSRIAIGGSRGTSGASLAVEAFGDAVLPQIPEAIGRAIWRVEEALAVIRS